VPKLRAQSEVKYIKAHIYNLVQKNAILVRLLFSLRMLDVIWIQRSCSFVKHNACKIFSHSAVPLPLRWNKGVQKSNCVTYLFLVVFLINGQNMVVPKGVGYAQVDEELQVRLRVQSRVYQVYPKLCSSRLYIFISDADYETEVIAFS
jgi:hypothetical protein